MNIKITLIMFIKANKHKNRLNEHKNYVKNQEL